MSESDSSDILNNSTIAEDLDDISTQFHDVAEELSDISNTLRNLCDEQSTVDLGAANNALDTNSSTLANTESDEAFGGTSSLGSSLR